MRKRALHALLVIVLIIAAALAATYAAKHSGKGARAAIARVVGGAPARGKPQKHWTEFATWDELREHKALYREALKAQTEALRDLDLDWSAVTAKLAPKLKENREYAGVIVPDRENPKKMLVGSCEASPFEIDSGELAEIPAEMTEKLAVRPSLFIYHTHPHSDRIGAGMLPSAQDLKTCIRSAFAGRHMAAVVVNDYGVVLYGPKEEAFRVINSAKRGAREAALEYADNVAAAVMSMRSWRPYTIDEYRAHLDRLNMMCIIYPSSSLYPATVYKYKFYLQH